MSQRDDRPRMSRTTIAYGMCVSPDGMGRIFNRAYQTFPGNLLPAQVEALLASADLIRENEAAGHGRFADSATRRGPAVPNPGWCSAWFFDDGSGPRLRPDTPEEVLLRVLLHGPMSDGRP